MAAAALGREDAPSGYSMRGGSACSLISMLDEAGLARSGGLDPGDIVLMQAGPRQFHLGIWTGEGLVHADAGLRRVVETPGPPRWPVIGAWRGAE